MSLRPTIDEVYRTYIDAVLPHQKAIGKEKGKDKKEFKKFFLGSFSLFGSILVLPCILTTIGTEDTEERITLIFISLGMVIILFILSFFLSKDFLNIGTKIEYKFTAIEPILKLYGNIKWTSFINWNPERKIMITQDSLERSKLFVDFDKLNFDDVFYGEYEGINFEVAEIDTHKNLRNNYIDGFKGIVFAFDYYLNSTEHTIIASKTSLILKNSFHNWLLYVLSMFSFTLILGLILIFTIQDYTMFIISLILIITATIFGMFQFRNDNKYISALFKAYKTFPLNNFYKKYFNVYSTASNEEVQDIITPEFWDALFKLQNVLKARNVKCSFFDNKLIIAVATKKDLFEIGNKSKNIKDIRNVEDLYTHINAIYDLMDNLNLRYKTLPEE